MTQKEKKEIIRKVIKFMEKRLEDDYSGHDWWHVWRVWRTAQYLSKFIKVNKFVVELGALLHDVADWKFYGGDMEEGAKEATKLLKRLKVEKKVIDQVCEIIRHISFKGEGVRPEPLSREGQIVQDADRLDSTGAVGIARTFAYGGARSKAIYDPEKRPAHFQNFKQYLNNKSSSINHFYERLFLVKDLMNTKVGKKIAAKRHKILEKFLVDFKGEWEAEDFE